ncbi:AAA family ATPase [Tistrella bauzanensis]|uniref:AAA family ATPase n=1 Tax=Tistrella TaxID=171436 RepID=UPI0031F6974E
MNLSAISISRYRSIREKTRLGIRPITILIGKNGSGKSVISRLPLIISEGLHFGKINEPINIGAGGVRHAVDYEDIPYMKSALPFVLGIEFDDVTGKTSIEVTFRYVKERSGIIVDSFQVDIDGRREVEIALCDDEQLIKNRPKYRSSGNCGRDCGVAGFSGFLPVVEGDGWSQWKKIEEKIISSFPQASYLGPFRTEVGHFIGSPRQGINFLGAQGEMTVEILADDLMRGHGRLIDDVSAWFERAMGCKIRLEKCGNYFKILVQESDGDFGINLSDTGAGFSQVLPIVVQAYLSKRRRDLKSAFIVEQPELHLHPAAHGNLADLFIEAMNHSGPILIETHSEQIIMRIRRRIAEGLDPKNVVLWSVGHGSGENISNSTIKEIHFDKSGDPDDWPSGVFEESFNDIAAIRKAVREHEN